MKKVIIFGNGQIAEVAYFYLQHDSEYEVVAFTVHEQYLHCDVFHGLAVIAFEKIAQTYPPSEFYFFAPISYQKVNQLRASIYHQAKDLGYEFIRYISSKASYYGTPVGENCFIMENNVIQPYSTIGNNVVLWSGNHLGHHSRISDHCFLASHIVVSGSVHIGEYTFIGVNATLRDNINIGCRNIIGAGALILKDTPDYAVFPAKGTDIARISSDKIRKI